MRENFMRMKREDREYLPIDLEIDTKVNFMLMKNLEKEQSFTKVELDLKEFGKK